MSLNPRLVQESFAHIEPVSDAAAGYFYGRLFAENPRLRALFPPTMDAQRDRLFLALTAIVRSIDSPDALAGYLDRLGRGHRRFGVLREHYAAMGAALIATVRRFAGTNWNSDIEAAWNAAYAVAAAMMIKAAETDALTAPPWWIAEVLRHEPRTPDIAVLTLRPNLPLPFTAGQHVSVQTARWPRVWRPYSIANAPRADGTISLHVRAVPGGWVSGALVRATKTGDTVLLGAALGDMAVDPTADRDLLLLAGGTGLAPLKAMVEQIAASGAARNTHLVFGARTEADLYDLPELRRLAAMHPWLRVTPVVSADPSFRGARGTVGEFLAGTAGTGGIGDAGGADGVDRIPGISDLRDCDAYVCGPPAMVTESVARLRETGVPADRIHRDHPAGDALGLTASALAGPSPVPPASGAPARRSGTVPVPLAAHDARTVTEPHPAASGTAAARSAQPVPEPRA